MFGLDPISLLIGLILGWLIVPMVMGVIAKKRA